MLSQTDYENVLNEVIIAKVAVKKTQKQRRRLKRFQVIVENDRNRLICPGTEEEPVYFLPIEEIYDTINTAHVSSGHGGRDRLRHALKQRYANITYDMITEFLKGCETCHAKKSIPSAGYLTKAIVKSAYLQQAQVGRHAIPSRW